MSTSRSSPTPATATTCAARCSAPRATWPWGHAVTTWSRPSRHPSRASPATGSTRFRPAYDAEISDWVDSLDDGRPTANAWDGYAATVVAEALVRALQTGHREAVSVGPRPDLYR